MIKSWPFFSRLLPSQIYTGYHGEKLFIDTRDFRQMKIAFLSTGLNAWYLWFGNAVREGMTVIDVGAHIGDFTVIAAKRVGKTGKVFAFEPTLQSYNLASKNINEHKLSNVILEQLIVSNKNGKTHLWFDKYSSGSNSISANNLHYGKGGSIEVNQIKLDDYLSNSSVQPADVGILKMNVEGSEGRIIAGAENLLREGSPIIMMEFWPYGLKQVGDDAEKLFDLLLNYGYTASMIDTKLGSEAHRIRKGDLFPLKPEFQIKHMPQPLNLHWEKL